MYELTGRRCRQPICVLLILAICLGPEMGYLVIPSAHAGPRSVEPPRTEQALAELVEALIAATSDMTDTDLDGLPDTVEAVIGTDPGNADSDFDRLDDYQEATGNLDPLDPDSNHDGLVDYLEVNDVPSADMDGDGLPNAWDSDNDGDGVNDRADMSPFWSSGVHQSVRFDVTTGGLPMFATLQITPEDPSHLLLFGRTWDWPNDDDKGAIKDLDDSREDVSVYPMLDVTVNVPPEQGDVLLYGVGVDGNRLSVPLVPVLENGTVVALSGRIPYPVAAPEDLSIEARLVWNVVGKNDPDADSLGEQALFVTYGEPFHLTGLAFDESHGVDVGLFYSDDESMTVAANLALAYDFLRHPTSTVSDMPASLAAEDVIVTDRLASYVQRDAALVAIANELTPAALDELGEGRTLPLVTILEERSKSFEMSALARSPGESSAFVVDLAAQPLRTSKILKTPWYDTTTRKALSTQEVLATIEGMALETEAAYTLMTMMLYWNTGEGALQGPGIPPHVPPGAQEYETVSDTIGNIASWGVVGIGLLYDSALGLKGLSAYRSISLLQSKGWSLSRAGEALPDLAKLGKLGKIKTWLRECRRIEKTASSFKSVNKLLEGLDAAVAFLDAGLAAYSIIALSQSSDLSGYAFTTAALQIAIGYFITAINLMIEALLAAIPYVGWILAIGYALSNVLGDWSNALTDWIVSWMTNVNYTVTPSVEIPENPTLTIDDVDGNGVDVGDRIGFRSDIKGTLTGSANRWDLISRSELLSYYTISAPPGSSSNVDYLDSNVFVTPLGNLTFPIPPRSDWTHTEDRGVAWRAQQYEAGGWVEPGIAMPNFPVTVRLDSFYELWYEWEHFVFLVFYGFWCQHEDRQYGIVAGDTQTIYIDVFPGSIADFASWSAIAPLDRDGDGLEDIDEAGSSDPWKWDTDGDGLNDKYELDAGTDPARHDSDGDGLSDLYELQYQTDPMNPDTDGDGLQDYLEIAGWLVPFNYGGPDGPEFVIRVNSDPSLPDTDGDGIEDRMEYRSGLSPRTGDTDGDGIEDVANPRVETTYLEFLTAVEFLDPWPADRTDIAIGPDGAVYVLADGMIRILDPDLDYQSSIFDPQLSRASSLAVDGRGYIHVGYGSWYDDSGVVTYLPDGTQVYPGPWATLQSGGVFRTVELATDRQDNLYLLRLIEEPEPVNDPVYGPTTIDVRKARIDIFDADGNPVSTWGEYGTFVSAEGTAPSGFKTWRLSYVSEIDQFNDVAGLTIDKNQGHVYVSESGTVETLLEWKPWPIYGWDLVSKTKLRPDRVAKYDTDGGYLRDLFEFEDPTTHETAALDAPVDVATDAAGYLYVADANGIHKFDRNMVPVASWPFDSSGGFSTEDRREELALNGGLDIYTVHRGGDEVTGYSAIVEKYAQRTDVPPPIVDPDPDRDGDGLDNDLETAGWSVTFTVAGGVESLEVTSDPLIADTDLDGLSDQAEYDAGTDPRSPDTDRDGLTDAEDPYPTHFDGDLDGLPDGDEVTYGSDPTRADSDADGLTDAEERDLGSDPQNADTDRDGLSDSVEVSFDSDPTSPDSDGDFMFDAGERAAGTDPRNGDSDQDGLLDGIESTHGTDPMNRDSDGDDLDDGLEIETQLNPLSADTDGDGLPDGMELENGTNPWDRDSDRDGIPDGQDDDSVAPRLGDVVLAYDPGSGGAEFATRLARYADVRVVPADELSSRYEDAPRMVLIGRPDGGQPVGTIVHDLLADTGSVLTDMIASDEHRLAVRHGVWTETQTVVLLSAALPADYLLALDALRRTTVSVRPRSVTVQYNTSTEVRYPPGGSADHGDLDYSFFEIDEIDTVKQTNATVHVSLEEAVSPTVEMTRYVAATTPERLDPATGLADGEIDVGRYLQITPSEDVQNDAREIVDEACVQVYYTPADLDRNGDGDIDDREDIDEASLELYRYDRATGRWFALDPEPAPGGTQAGVETEDVELYGDSYAGYVWACTSDLPLFAVAGRPHNRPPDTSGAHAQPDSLWPPNHKFVEVLIEGVTDPDGDEIEITITGITSDEPLSGSGGWRHSPDASGIGSETASLRAERKGQGNGRVYVIDFLAVDEYGGESTGAVSVCVPHDRRRECVDDGQLFDAAGSARGPARSSSSNFRETKPPPGDRSRRRR